MDRPAIRTALESAAAYLDEHGLKAVGFGKEGGPVCMIGALAVALGLDPRRLGLGPFFKAGLTPKAAHVAEVVIRGRLLHLLPVPEPATWDRRRPRPELMSAGRALRELARWSDAPGRTAQQAAYALRAAAARL